MIPLSKNNEIYPDCSLDFTCRYYRFRMFLKMNGNWKSTQKLKDAILCPAYQDNRNSKVSDQYAIEKENFISTEDGQ